MGDRRQPKRGDIVFHKAHGFDPEPAIVRQADGMKVELRILENSFVGAAWQVKHRLDVDPLSDSEWWCWPDEVVDDG